MKALLHRALVFVTGMPDEVDSYREALANAGAEHRGFKLPGYWGRTGGARIDTEMDCDVAPDASRTFSGRYSPRYGSSGFATTSADWRRWIVRAVMAAAVMAALIESFPQ